MELGGSASSLPEATDISTALRTAAERLGHRPALTVLRSDRRDEQGFASLLKWTSKGSHLLELECLVEEGSRVRLHAPADWISAAVCLAAWWSGAVVTTDRDGEVAVFHHSLHAPTEATYTYVLGDGIDGSPVEPTDEEAWSSAVQTFPDQPPAPGGTAGTDAVESGRWTVTQEELLDAARQWGDDGPLGVAANVEPGTWMPAIVRPLVTGRPTVILAGAERAAAEAEGVAIWA